MKYYRISEDQLRARNIARTGLEECYCKKEELRFVELFASEIVGISDINEELVTNPEHFEKRDGRVYRKKE